MVITMKVLGKRREEVPGSVEDTAAWLRTVRQLRGGKGLCPVGVYRFRTFEEAEQWSEFATLIDGAYRHCWKKDETRAHMPTNERSYCSEGLPSVRRLRSDSSEASKSASCSFNSMTAA